MDLKSNISFPLFDIRHPVYSEDMTPSIISVILYVSVFLVSVARNLAPMSILAKFCGKINFLKNLFLINLSVANFSGKSIFAAKNKTKHTHSVCKPMVLKLYSFSQF